MQRSDNSDSVATAAPSEAARAVVNSASHPPSHTRGWVLGVGLTAALLAAASWLAANALPRNPHSRTPTPVASPENNESSKPALSTNSATQPGADGSRDRAATITGEFFGPPERVKTIAEKAIVPLLVQGDATTDVARVKSALANIAGRRTSQALAIANTLDNNGARKLVQWYAYRRVNSGVEAQVIEDFRNDNPTWPERSLLRQRAEEALLLDNAPPRVIRTFFDKTPPMTAAGHAALATAELTDGNTDDAVTRFRRAWRDGNFGATVEAHMMARFKTIITQDDIKWRLNQYLLDDDRYGRKSRLAVIRRMIKALKPDEAAEARARLAVWRSYRSRSRRRLNSAVKAIASIERKKSAAAVALPTRKPAQTNAEDEQNKGSVEPTASQGPAPADEPKEHATNTSEDDDTGSKTDWPYEYHRIQLLRRQGKNDQAWERLLDAPTATTALVAPDHWWEERRVNIFNALYRKKYDTAYRLAAFDAHLGANARNQSNFMAGWIAFRFLGDHKAALTHLTDFTKSADGPRTRAQSHYWLGRLHDVLGDKQASREAYETAAREFSAFYGQLAKQKLDPTKVTLAIPTLPTLTPERIERAQNEDVLQALRFAHLADNPSVTRRLLRAIGKSKQDAHTYQLAAEFAKTIGDTQMAVRIGKGAIFHGIPLTEYAYPTHAFPLFKPLVTPPEPAMLYGLARQESEFNTLVKSIVGARGVLQVMPATAHGVCREHRLKCGSRRALTRRLSRDPSYNATLAAAYVTGRLQEFGGSYILAYAGYNAGPGRARYWIGKSGDPRDPEVDPIDWIELIHLEETREYVKKVMANLQIYRARLGEPETALQISKDIERGSL